MLTSPPHPPSVQRRCRRQSGLPFDAKEYSQIKELWLDHIAAEHRGDIPGLLATLTTTASTRS